MKKILLTFIAICSVALLFGQTTTENYVKKTVYRTQTSTGNVGNSQKVETVTYFDGLGRPKQNVNLRAGSNGEDIITHVGYDVLGRQDKEHLPYAATGTSGSYRTNALSETSTFYDASEYEPDFPGVSVNDINAYSQKEFEASPLNRVLKQGAPGKDWKLGEGNEIVYEYTTNTNTEVRYYEVSLTKDVDNNVVTYIPTLILDTSSGNNNGYYPANSLYKSIIKDENHDGTNTKNRTTEEFKDKKGRVVLKRTYADVDLNNDGDTNDTGETEVSHDTYYVYDKFGNLSYVLPPKVEAHVDKPYENGMSEDNNEMNELCYKYLYDEKNRLIGKRIPGKSWEYIVYNNLDEPIMTQDYFSYRGSLGWNFTKYDAYGRVAYTGQYTTYSMGIDTWRTTYQNNANSQSVNYETKLSANPSNLGGTTVYYTDNTYPNNIGNYCNVLTINYYDDYNFDIGSGTPETSGGVTPITNPKGLPTGSKERILGTNQWITTITYYDNESRPIYIYSHNEYLGTTDKVKNEYDFTGNILKSTTTHTRSGNTIITVDTFTYDDLGRPLSQNQKIDNQPQETIISNIYDELGQLVSKGVGGQQISNEFIDEVNLNITTNTITKTHNSSSWNAGLATAKSITNDGYVEYKIAQTNKAIMVGLSSDNSSASYTTIDYAMYTRHDGYVYVYESGSNKTGAIETYQAGDTFRVERIGSTIYYKRNGAIIYTSTVSSSGILIGDVSIHHYQGAIFDLNIYEPSKALQDVNYSYNIRGWLKQINNPTSIGNDLFAYKIGYNEGANPLYNGNISLTQWRTANTDNGLKTYNYQYDALNRIVSAIDNLDRYSLSNVLYDRNGNIKRLKRKGHIVAQPVSTNSSHFGVMDDLRYTYQSHSNKLLKVEDVAAVDAFGYKDDAVNQAPDTVDDYSYTNGGSLESDYTKTLLFLSYNHLGLPVDVMNYSNNATIQYIYTASGTKLKKIVSTGATTEYAGNYVYEGGSLKFFNHPEGYVDTSSSGYEYVYQYKDHLGNVRLSYSDVDNDGVISEAGVFNDDLESASGWDSLGALHGGAVTAYDTTIKHSGNYSGKIVKTTSGEKYVHSNTWLEINNSTPTEYKYSGWVYTDGPSVQLFLFMNEENETGYYTTFSHIYAPSGTNQWIYVENTVTVPTNISKLNIRIDNNGGGTVWFDDIKIEKTSSEILEENNYYPFGLKHKGYNDNPSAFANPALKWKYNGVEYEEALGLDLYEMDVRSYDPAIARFTSIDPVTHHSMSTYMAFDGNPVYWADPSGADAEHEAWVTQQMEEFNSFLSSNSSGFGTSSNIDQTYLKYQKSAEVTTGELTDGCDDCTLCPENCSDDYFKDYFSSKVKEAERIKQGGLTYDISNKGITNLNSLSRYVSLFSTAWGVVDINLATGTYLTTQGIRKTIYLANGKVRSARAGMFATQMKLARTGSYGFAGLGIALDGYGIYNYYNYPDDQTVYKVHPVMGGLNTIATVIGLYGGPWGWLISGTYFGFQYLSDEGYISTLKDYKSRTGGGCFIEGTQIEMANGSNKDISLIKKGDKIKTFNTKLKIFEEKKVLAVYKGYKKNLIEITFSDKTVNINTDIHPYFVKEKGWCSYNSKDAKLIHSLDLKTLNIGDIVYKYNDGSFKEVQIISINKVKGYTNVFNIMEIKDNHNFLANGVLVHNKFGK